MLLPTRWLTTFAPSPDCKPSHPLGCVNMPIDLRHDRAH